MTTARTPGRRTTPKPATGDLDETALYYHQYPRPGNVMGYAVRTDRFRYVEWLDRDSRRIKARELYDHANDPQENVNVVDRTDYAGDVARLHAILKGGWREALPE